MVDAIYLEIPLSVFGTLIMEWNPNEFYIKLVSFLFVEEPG